MAPFYSELCPHEFSVGLVYESRNVRCTKGLMNMKQLHLMCALLYMSQNIINQISRVRQNKFFHQLIL